MKRLLLLSSLTVGVAAACQLAPPESSGPPTTTGGRPSVDAGRSILPPGPTEDPCSVGPFVPPVIPSPVAPRVACTDDRLTALAKACAKEPEGATCTTARNLAENASCADCIFGAKTDAEWKMIILQPGEAPATRYNQAGCIELATGVKDCGKHYFTVVACFDHFCVPGCPPRGDETLCQKEVGRDTGKCKPFLIDEECGNALDGVEKTCFPMEQTDVAIEALFVNMGRTFCQRIADAGSEGG